MEKDLIYNPSLTSFKRIKKFTNIALKGMDQLNYRGEHPIDKINNLLKNF